MTVHQPGSHVRLRILVLDGVESFFLVALQRFLDIFEAGWVNVVQVVGKNDGVLHRVHSTSSTAWEEFVGGYNKSKTNEHNVFSLDAPFNNASFKDHYE